VCASPITATRTTRINNAMCMRPLRFAIYAWAESWLTGRGGRQRSAHCETKEMTCPAGLAVTGLGVKSGHIRKHGNRELYDFRLRTCRGYIHAVITCAKFPAFHARSRPSQAAVPTPALSSRHGLGCASTSRSRPISAQGCARRART
jgi:hypothetical protein